MDVGLRFIFLLVAPVICGIAGSIGGERCVIDAFECFGVACIIGVAFCVPEALWCLFASVAWLLRKNTGVCGVAARACLSQSKRHLQMPLRAIAYIVFGSVCCILLGELAGLYDNAYIVLICCAPVVLLPELRRLVRALRRSLTRPVGQ